MTEMTESKFEFNIKAVYRCPACRNVQRLTCNGSTAMELADAMNELDEGVMCGHEPCQVAWFVKEFSDWAVELAEGSVTVAQIKNYKRVLQEDQGMPKDAWYLLLQMAGEHADRQRNAKDQQPSPEDRYLFG